jgi:hypothetical protein
LDARASITGRATGPAYWPRPNALDLDETSFDARLRRLQMRLRRTEEAAKDIRRLMRDQPDHRPR